VEERPQTRYVSAPGGVSLAYQVFGEGPLDLLWGRADAFAYDLMWDEPSFGRSAPRGLQPDHLAHAKRIRGVGRTSPKVGRERQRGREARHER
jgi:hypothetical protein